MSERFAAVINREGECLVTHCVELSVVSKGKFIE